MKEVALKTKIAVTTEGFVLLVDGYEIYPLSILPEGVEDGVELNVMFNVETYIDPPHGWKYGFPKPYDGSLFITDFLLANGYPEAELQNNLEHTSFYDRVISPVLVNGKLVIVSNKKELEMKAITETMSMLYDLPGFEDMYRRFVNTLIQDQK